MKKLLITFLLTFISMDALAAVYQATNVYESSIIAIDGGSKSYTVTIGGTGESISDVNVELIFGKSDNSCSSFGTDNGEGYNSEIAYRLQSPTGTTISLIENSSGDAGATGPSYTNDDTFTPLDTTVTLDDAATNPVVGTTNSGTPETGIFQPVVALSAFNGEDPSGDWTLTGYDDDSGDPLCHQSFRLTVTTNVTVHEETKVPPPTQSVALIDDGSKPFSVTIGGAGQPITNVNIELTFGKSDDSCYSFGTDGGEGYNKEIAYRLQSPTGTTISLIENSSGNAGATGPSYANNSTTTPLDTTVTLDDAATNLVGTTNGGTPETGIFKPVVALSAFNGEDPSGDWTLTGYDDSLGDPLCHQSFRLTVTTDYFPWHMFLPAFFTGR